MPAVKPPEWETMSAKEQLLWYLERLCAQADEMSSALGTASTGAPLVVTTLVDPAASTTTLASSAPVADVSGSTTKAQEVLAVTHYVPPACVTMGHITCSTDGSNQAVATNSANKVTTVCPEPFIDLSDKFGALNIHVTASTNPPLHVQVSSPKSSPDSTHGIAVAGPEEYALVAATPDVVLKLAVRPNVILIIPSDLSAPMLTTCSTKYSRHDTNLLRYVLHPAVAPSWMVLRPKPWPSFWRDHADGNAKRPMSWPSLGCSHELYWKHVGLLSEDTFAMKHFYGVLNSMRESWKYLQSMQLKLPWPSFSSNGRAVPVWPEIPNELAGTFGLHKIWSASNLVRTTQIQWKISEHRARDLADRNEVRPIPWPSFPIGRSLELLFLLAQVHDCGLIGIAFPLELCHISDLECNLPRHYIRIPPVQIFCLSSLQQNTDDSCFAKQLLHEGKQWFPELDARSHNTALAMQHCYLPTMSVHLPQFMQSGPYELVCFMQSSSKLCAQKAPSVFKFSHKIVRLKLPSYMNEGIPCVQPTYYLEGVSARAYLKLREVCAAVVCMFEGSTIQIWVNLGIVWAQTTVSNRFSYWSLLVWIKWAELLM
ncbi:hypothetical protein VPH35_138830 [Triticum aestivum]